MNPTTRIETWLFPEGPGTREVVVEEPLEIRLDGEPVAVTLRTPGDDLELALGFLVSEGVVRDLDALESVLHCDDSPNVVEVRTRAGASGVEPAARRTGIAHAGCGLCGKATLDAVRVLADALHEDATQVRADALLALPARLREQQRIFQATGALHAAGLFSARGELHCVREDVGRHNAVDKVVGWAAMRRALPLGGCVLLLSGRCGFELVQKAHVAGIPIVAAISGPSSLAIDLAREVGITLASFVRDSTMNVSSHPERIVP